MARRLRHSRRITGGVRLLARIRGCLFARARVGILPPVINEWIEEIVALACVSTTRLTAFDVFLGRGALSFRWLLFVVLFQVGLVGHYCGKIEKMFGFWCDTLSHSLGHVLDVRWFPYRIGLVDCEFVWDDCYGIAWRIFVQSKRIG